MPAPAVEDLLDAARRSLRTGAALRAAFALRGVGGAREIAAQEALRDAALDELAGMVARGQHQAALQPTVTVAANALCQLAGLYDFADRRADARRALDEAEALAERHGDAARRALVRIDVAAGATTSGQFARGVGLLLDVRDALQFQPVDPAAQINPHLKLGRTLAEAFTWLGDWARAAAELGRTRRQLSAIMLAAGIGPGTLAAFFRGNDAAQLRMAALMVLLDARRFRRAARMLDLIEPVYAALGAAPAAAMQTYRVRIAAGLGDTEGALAILARVWPTFETEPDLAHKRGVLRTLRARVLIEAGRGAGALADAAEGAGLEAACADRDTLWNAHWQHARALGAAGGDGLAAFDAALAAMDGQRRASLGYRLDSLYLRARRPMVDEAVLAAAARGDALRCLRYAELVKARFLAAALLAGPPPDPDPAAVSQLDRLSAAVDALRRGSPDPDAIRRTLAARAGVLERMRIERGELPAPPLDPGAILDGLAARGQAALQLYRAGDRIVAVLLHDGALHLETMDLTPATQAGLTAYGANLRLATPSRLDYDPARLGLDAACLVPPGLLERALGATALLVAPHGQLNALPWAGLGHGGQLLFQRLDVALAPNIAAIPLLAGRARPLARAALFGDPHDAALTAAEGRAELGPGLVALAALYGPARLAGQPLTGPNATLAGLRAAIADAPPGTALHLACHGRFDHDDPAGSGLLLADRTLTAAEIALRPLPFAEVTMAACSTGVRPEAAGGVRLLGDDLVGLPASLLEAGAGSVLASTTVAGAAASAAFFVAYHTRRLDGDSPIAAYGGAQRALLAEGAQPLRNWIGFTLYSG